MDSIGKTDAIERMGSVETDAIEEMEIAETEAIKIENFSFIYPLREHPCLRNINLKVQYGEFVCLLYTSDAADE